ncbi:hypothetical protein BV898_16733 [Hypsibius exemplaris]|uniref:Uncharacterized protein n=1 Tax=Hypsibius exemplaris TaxID=2072580 RepID=A0A9X6NDT0_HYPEX|nr:hypothetical protein BV898_16733 [Hypsibius exemplaris]
MENGTRFLPCDQLVNWDVGMPIIAVRTATCVTYTNGKGRTMTAGRTSSRKRRATSVRNRKEEDDYPTNTAIDSRSNATAIIRHVLSSRKLTQRRSDEVERARRTENSRKSRRIVCGLVIGSADRGHLSRASLHPDHRSDERVGVASRAPRDGLPRRFQGRPMRIKSPGTPEASFADGIGSATQMNMVCRSDSYS